MSISKYNKYFQIRRNNVRSNYNGIWGKHQVAKTYLFLLQTHCIEEYNNDS